MVKNWIWIAQPSGAVLQRTVSQPVPDGGLRGEYRHHMACTASEPMGPADGGDRARARSPDCWGRCSCCRRWRCLAAPREGRQLLLAALVFGANYFSNIGDPISDSAAALRGPGDGAGVECMCRTAVAVAMVQPCFRGRRVRATATRRLAPGEDSFYAPSDHAGGGISRIEPAGLRRGPHGGTSRRSGFDGFQLHSDSGGLHFAEDPGGVPIVRGRGEPRHALDGICPGLRAHLALAVPVSAAPVASHPVDPDQYPATNLEHSRVADLRRRAGVATRSGLAMDRAPLSLGIEQAWDNRPITFWMCGDT